MRDCPQDVLPLLRTAIDENAVVPWYRARPFQDLSLRLVLQRLLHLEAAYHRDTLYIPTELTRRPPTLASAETTDGSRFHLYCSPNNPGAGQVVAAMQLELNAVLGSSRGELKIAVTCQASEMLEAQHVLVYLNARTHTMGERAAQLHGARERSTSV